MTLFAISILLVAIVAIHLCCFCLFFKTASHAIICHQCSSITAIAGSDPCSDPSAGTDQLVACPVSQTVCYTTLGVVENRVVVNRGCGQPPSSSTQIRVNTCHAISDATATAINCVCAGAACNTQTAATQAVQDALSVAQPTQVQRAVDADSNREARNIIQPSAERRTIVIPIDTVRPARIVEQSTTTTTTSMPDTTTVTNAPTVVERAATVVNVARNATYATLVNNTYYNRNAGMQLNRNVATVVLSLVAPVFIAHTLLRC